MELSCKNGHILVFNMRNMLWNLQDANINRNFGLEILLEKQINWSQHIENLKELRNLTHHSCVVIIFFDTVLCKSAFFTNSFGKLVFYLSLLSALCRIEFNVTFINFITFASHDNCLYNYQVLCFCSHLVL